jgi:hypothetical protein
VAFQLPAGALNRTDDMLSALNAYNVRVPPLLPGVLSAQTIALPEVEPFDETIG